MQSQSDSVVENSLDDEAVSALAPEPVPPEPPGPPPGEILRNAREARRESLVDVAHTLKLSAQQLEALENGRYDVLPGPTFVRGFLRNYARYLDLPPEPLLEGISTRVPTAADLASMLKLDGNVQPAASPRPRSGIVPAALIVLGLLAVAGLVWAGIHFKWFDDLHRRFDSPAAAPAREKTVPFKLQTTKLERPMPVDIAPESVREPPNVESEQEIASYGTAVPASALGQTPLAAAPPAPEVATLRLLFNASTLALVRDKTGKLIFARTGTKGTSNSVKGKPPLSVMIKQANNVKLEFNGQAVDLKGHTGRDGIARLNLQ